ncbi:MAG: transporter [Telluria sp.]
MKTRYAIAAAAIAAAFPFAAQASCGSAFCTVNTNWTAQSAMVDAGSSYDLRYEYIDQGDVFTGTRHIAVGEIPHHHNEVSTKNRNLVATYSYNFGNGWGVTVSGAEVDKDHYHIHNHHGVPLDERWKFTELSDLRVTGRYQVMRMDDPLKPVTMGMSFGAKLPTGSTTVANADGDVAERGLQPGTGTTDGIIGAYYHQKLIASDVSWFAQATFQAAFKPHDHYRPGNSFGADIGVRKGVGDKFGLLLQLNAVRKGREAGTEGEPADSGQRAVFLSPGVSYAVGQSTQLYGYVQQALYRDVNGVQLTARRAFVFGLAGHL